MPQKTKPFRILSIDGGGIRGIIPALIMAEIEKRTGKQMYELFDFMAGTSTGGILALGLSLPLKNGKPYTALDLVKMYEEKGTFLFQKSFVQKIWGADLLEEMYSQDGIETLLKEYFQTHKLSETMPNVNVLVTAYEIEQRKPWFFKSHRAKNDISRDFLAWNVARATSAAPTYFEPFKINLPNNQYLALVDGGVFANNPALSAFAEAKVMLSEKKPIISDETESREVDSMDLPEPDDDNNYFMVSIGTGALTQSYKYADAVNWGKLQWLNPLISILMQGVSDAVDYQMRQLLPNTLDGKSRYYRFQSKLSAENEEMDNVSVENIAGLKSKAAELIQEHSDALDELCKQLLEM